MKEKEAEKLFLWICMTMSFALVACMGVRLELLIFGKITLLLMALIVGGLVCTIVGLLNIFSPTKSKGFDN